MCRTISGWSNFRSHAQNSRLIFFVLGSLNFFFAFSACNRGLPLRKDMVGVMQDTRHTHPFPSFLFSFIFYFYFLFPSDSYTTNNTSIISFSRLFQRNVWDCLLNVSGIVCKLPENCPRRTKHNQDVTHFVFPLPILYRETDKKFITSCSMQQQNAWSFFL